MKRSLTTRTMTAAAGAGLLLPLLWTPVRAGTTGKLTGRVTDEAKAPLTGVNVTIPAVRLGAITDADGRYLILNVPAGTYDVKFALLGYQPLAVQNVVVSADLTTTRDAAINTAPVALPEVVVSAQRPVVDLSRTSSLVSVSRKEIQNLPVQELNDIVKLQAGVVDNHFRGGRAGEVQYQVDGVSVNNVYDNTATLKLDRSLLEEVQVITGTFDAEYGQAMSGVVNAVLRRGTDQFRWDAEVYGGSFVFPATDRIQPWEFRPAQVGNGGLTLSGPTGITKTTYLASARAYRFDDWVYGTRRFVPTDRSDFQNKVYRGTGDGQQVPLGYSREWSGIVKLTNRSLSRTELNYQAVFNHIDARRAGDPEFVWRYNPEGLPRQTTKSITHGLDWTQTLSPKSYVTLAVRQNYFDYQDRVYDDLYDIRYDQAGPPTGDANYDNGLNTVIQGVSPARFRQETNALVSKASWVNQFRHDQQVKAGLEFQWPTMRFGSMGYIVPQIVNGVEKFVHFESDPPTYPGVTTYHPRLGAAFAQDDLEWNDLKIRAGLRLDYFDAAATLPSNLRNPANVLPPPNPQSTDVRVPSRTSVAPRVGVSYPVTRDAALFFAYGHFYQMPPLGTTFTNADYRVLSTLQAGTGNYGRVMGNPAIRPERTVQYQFGYKQAITPDLGIELSIFYKDIRDLLGVEFITTYNDAEYARLTNVDFGGVEGITLMLDQRSIGPLSASLDYTWQTARGNSSDPNETATRAQAGQDPRPRQVPFNWDQRHTLNLTMVLSQADVYSASAIVRIASGQPYTPSIAAGFSGSLETGSGRKPSVFDLDLRAERYVTFGDVHASLFGRVFNAFDTRFFNGYVFNSTGSPYYSRDIASDRNQLATPSRYYAPRRFEAGVTLRGGSGQ
jgi:outer membrane receptor protein involved in Fe transport